MGYLCAAILTATRALCDIIYKISHERYNAITVHCTDNFLRVCIQNNVSSCRRVRHEKQDARNN